MTCFKHVLYANSFWLQTKNATICFSEYANRKRTEINLILQYLIFLLDEFGWNELVGMYKEWHSI